MFSQVLLLQSRTLLRSTSFSECVVPVIGVPISPGMVDFSKRFISSIDFTTSTVVIIVNGDDSETNAWVESLVPNNHIRSYIKVFAPNNLGVAGSTNRIMFETPDADFWFINNNDIELLPGSLANLCRAARDADGSVGSLHPVMKSGIFPHRDHGWSSFVLRKSVLESIGIWDENLWPAYAEDGDYETRLYGAGLRMQRVSNSFVWHGPRGVKAYTSGTERSRSENRHPFFEKTLEQVKAADREAYTALKYAAWASNYNADAIYHFKANPFMFLGCKPVFGLNSKLGQGFWAFDAARRACIVGAEPPQREGIRRGFCDFDLKVLGSDSTKVNVNLLTSWNGADRCLHFSECLAIFQSMPLVLRVVKSA